MGPLLFAALAALVLALAAGLALAAVARGHAATVGGGAPASGLCDAWYAARRRGAPAEFPRA